MGLFNRRKAEADKRPTVSNDNPPVRRTATEVSSQARATEALAGRGPVAPQTKAQQRVVPVVYCLTEEDVSAAFDGIGAIQREQDERPVDPVDAAQRIVALADGLAGYYLRRGGNRNLYSTLVENLLSWSNVVYASRWMRSMGTPEGDEAEIAHKVIRDFWERHKFLEETGGRAVPGAPDSPFPSTIEAALVEDGWRRQDEGFLVRTFDSPDHFVQDVILVAEEGGFELTAALMELPEEESPAWIDDSAVAPLTFGRLEQRVVLRDRIVDQRTPMAEMTARAAALAQKATDLEALHADEGDRQLRLTAREAPEGSLAEAGFGFMAVSRIGFGIYGPGTLDEAMAEFARLNPAILTSIAATTGQGYALGSVNLPMITMTGPRGSLIVVSELFESDHNVMDAVNFGGPAVGNGWALMMISRGGVTFATIGTLLEGARAVPLWELEAFAGQRP